MNKNKAVTPRKVLRRGTGAVGRLALLTRDAFRVDPKRACVAVVCLVVVTTLIGAGLGGATDAGPDADGERRSIADMATDLFSGESPSRTTTPSSPDRPGSTTTATGETTTSLLAPDGTPVPSSTTALETPSSTTPNGLGSAPVPVATEAVSPSGLRLVVTASRNNPNTGQDIAFRAEVNDGSGALLGLQWDFGDGAISNSDPRTCSDAANRPSVNEGRTDFGVTATHRYRVPGDYTVRVTARTGTRCGARADNDQVTGTSSISVGGTAINNGSAAPTAMTTIVSGGTSADSSLGIRIKAADSDGYVSQVVVQWSAGATPEVITFPLSQCNDPRTELPSSSRDINRNHQFERGGVYDVTVTVMSTGCDGSQSQQAISVLNGITVGDPVQPAQTDVVEPAS